MGTPYWVVDAFADSAFAGNPAGVCLLEQPRDGGWMQAVAAEFGFSETAFLVPIDDGWDLRWFTPTVEVDLCGHATLASAAALSRNSDVLVADFHTRSGVLMTARTADGRFRLDLPADPVVEEFPTRPIEDAVGLPVVRAGRTRAFIIAQVEDPRGVRNVAPEDERVAALGSEGLILTSQQDGRSVSRYFAPNVGLPEDPVTGAAHCALALWWEPELGTTFEAEQASSRGGWMTVQLVGDRVHLTGAATIVAEGTLLA